MPRAPQSGKRRALAIAPPANREFAAALDAFVSADFSTCRALLDIAAASSSNAALADTVIDELRGVAPNAWLLDATQDARQSSAAAGRRRGRTS